MKWKENKTFSIEFSSDSGLKIWFMLGYVFANILKSTIRR